MWIATRPLIRIKAPNVWNKRCITTLDPRKITPDDYVDFKGRNRYPLRLPGKKRPVTLFFYTKVHGGKPLLVPWPKDTKGFFYFAPGPTHAPLAGELRFRVSRGTDTASFESGHDLINPETKMPWKKPLLRLAASVAAFSRIMETLVSDGLVSDDLLRLARSKTQYAGIHKSLTHSLGQPFVVDVRCQLECFYVTHGSDIHHVEIFSPWGTDFGWPKLQGHLLCCFEAVRDSKGNGAVAMRVLKILEPVTRVDPNCKRPLYTIAEGELVRTSRGEVWTLGQSQHCVPIAAARALLSTQDKDIGWIPPQLVRPAELAGQQYSLSRVIRRLRPESLQHEDMVDISNLPGPMVRFDDRTKMLSPWKACYLYKPGGCKPFPSATLGYFYAHLNPHHPISGQVRFRVMPDKDTTAFDSGNDLLLSSGLPWKAAFTQLLRLTAAPGLMSVLVRDGLIREEDAAHWMNSKHLQLTGRSAFVVLGDPFDLNLDAKSVSVCLGYGRDAVSFRVYFHAPLRTQFELQEKYRWARVCVEEQPNEEGLVLRPLRAFESTPMVDSGQDISESHRGKVARLYTRSAPTYRKYLELKRSDALKDR